MTHTRQANIAINRDVHTKKIISKSLGKSLQHTNESLLVAPDIGHRWSTFSIVGLLEHRFMPTGHRDQLLLILAILLSTRRPKEKEKQCCTAVSPLSCEKKKATYNTDDNQIENWMACRPKITCWYLYVGTPPIGTPPIGSALRSKPYPHTSG